MKAELLKEEGKWVVKYGDEILIRTSKKSNTIKNFKSSKKISKLGISELFEGKIKYSNNSVDIVKNDSHKNEINKQVIEDLKDYPFIVVGGKVFKQIVDKNGVVRYV